MGWALACKKLAANHVSGCLLRFQFLAERSLRIGDLVKVDNFEGRITDINTRYTVLRPLAGVKPLCPTKC